MARLWRGFRAAEKTASDLSVVSKGLHELAPELNLPKIPRELIHFDQEIKMITYNGMSTMEVVKNLKYGEFEMTMSKVYRDIGHVSEPVLLRLKQDVKDVPDFHIGNFDRASESLKKIVTKDMSEIDKEILTNPKRAEEVNKSFLERNPRLQKAVEFLNGKKFKTFTGVVVTVIGINAITQHQKRMAGCYRFSMDSVSGKLVVCRVASCSCENGSINSETNGAVMCDPSRLPEKMKDLNNCKNNSKSGLHCAECPPADHATEKGTKDPGNLSDPDSLSDLPEKDKVTYECKTPSWYDAFADITNNVMGDVEHVVGNVANELGSFFSLFMRVMKYLLIFVAIAGVIGLSVFAYTKLSHSNEISTSITTVRHAHDEE